MIGVIVSECAEAGLPWEPSFVWIAPTERVNGQPFNMLTEGSHYTLTCIGPGTISFDLPPDATSWQAPAGAFPPGTWDCTLVVVETDGEVSDPAVAAPFDVSTPPPNPPGGLTVN